MYFLKNKQTNKQTRGTQIKINSLSDFVFLGKEKERSRE